MYLHLKHYPNPDISGGYWSPELVAFLPHSIKVKVNSLEEASKKLLEFTEKYDLGGGNCPSVYVYDDNDNKLARISYNGRIWTSEEDL